MDMPDSAIKFQKLSDLGKDFVTIAEAYGKIIISEYYQPIHRKTIKPADIGGIAGGQKYICKGILFKVFLFGDLIYLLSSLLLIIRRANVTCTATPPSPMTRKL